MAERTYIVEFKEPSDASPWYVLPADAAREYLRPMVERLARACGPDLRVKTYLHSYLAMVSGPADAGDRVFGFPPRLPDGLDDIVEGFRPPAFLDLLDEDEDLHDPELSRG